MDWPNHDTAWQEWRGAMEGARMHHAWLLAGKGGLGKHDFANAAARELVKEEGIPQPVKDHPDIHTLTHLPKDDKEERKREKGEAFETKRNITVGQIRSMQQRLTTRPTLGSRRAIIINPADDMEKSASNALLKSLEEPPKGTFFLLVAHRPSRLLPTIRSRCRTVRFPSLKPAMLEQIITQNSPNSDNLSVEAAIAASGGSPGAAIEFLDQELGPIAAIFERILDSGDNDMTERTTLIKAAGQRPSRARIQAILGLAQTSLASGIENASGTAQATRVEAHQKLVTLTGQAPTHNFDPNLLLLEVSGLLASAGMASQ
ncbi:MAG: DNA polymerase III subunit delta' [Erythrobacter sp.]